MDTLDVHIQDKIYNYYWERQFYKNVIITLNNADLHINKFIIFMKKHILYNSNIITPYKYYLEKYNNILHTICNDKGMLMYFRYNYPFIWNLKSNIETYQIIKPKYCFVLKYLLSNSGSMRYYILEQFKKL